MELIKRLVKEEEGQGLVEYALIIALIAVLLIGALTLVKNGINTTFKKVSDNLTTAS